MATKRKHDEAEYDSTVTKKRKHKYICSPCDVDGQQLKAVGYCVNCREYLCRRCNDSHLIPTPSRKHKLLDEQRMHEVKAKNNSLCTEHEDKQIEYHCPTHSFFGCQMCFFKHQKGCRDVQFIPDVSETITDTGTYTGFTKRLANIVTKCKELSTKVKGKVETTTARHTEAVTAIKKFKIEVLDAVEKIEKELLEKIDTVKQEDTAKITEASGKCNEILQEAQTIASTVELLQNKQQNRDLYITVIRSNDSLLSLENDLQAIGTNTNTRYFAFHTNTDLLDMLKSPFGLGKMHQTDTIAKVEQVQDIAIKAGKDATICRAVCSVLLPDQKLVIVDISNSKIKLLDTRQNKLVSILKMLSKPLGVCQVTEKQIAVTLYREKKIALVKTSPTLSVDRTLPVDGTCQGVGYCDGKLVVSFIYPNKVEVLDIQGTVLKKIETDANGRALFNTPVQLSVNPENKLIYVSNYGSNNVVCMKFDGTVVARYEDQELQGPIQTVFSRRGAAFVCGYSSNNIHQITEDCTKVKVLLTSADGLDFPESVSYCERDNKLYIGLNRSDNLKVFKVTHATL